MRGKGHLHIGGGPITLAFVHFFSSATVTGDGEGGVGWFFQKRIIFARGAGRGVFDLVLHLAELIFELVGGPTKFRHSFAEGARELGEFLGTEYDERQSQNQKELGHADAEHEHKLFDFILLIKLSYAQLRKSLISERKPSGLPILSARRSQP